MSVFFFEALQRKKKEEIQNTKLPKHGEQNVFGEKNILQQGNWEKVRFL